MDGSGYPQLYPRCGTGFNNYTINIDGNVAYIKFVSDESNVYEGMRGIALTFSAKGQYPLYYGFL